VENREEIKDIKNKLVSLQKENKYLQKRTDALEHYVKQLLLIPEKE
jgi:cell division protein FtsB